MILTAYDKKYIKTKPNKLKTCGRYDVEEKRNHNGWCRCAPQYRIGEWPNNCTSCGSRIRI